MDRNTSKVWLVGGGIASMAAAAFMIRDGDIPGRNIAIFEDLGKLGGSLDAGGSPGAGYVLRGGRMFESKYLCTFSLFDSIPALSGDRTVTREIMAWNETMHTESKSRLVRDGHRETAPAFGLNERHIVDIARLAVESESMLGRTRISDQFDGAFFETNFWKMWCTTFAFQPWHGAVEFKRYLVRFAHMVGGFNRLIGIMRTPYNQYDAMVRPLRKWLDERGVVFEMNTRVTDLRFAEASGNSVVTHILTERAGTAREIAVAATDAVIVTLGSMTDASSVGSMDAAPAMLDKTHGSSLALWEKLADGRPAFGHPAVFFDHIDESKWVSFTTTMHDPMLVRMIGDFTGNVPGEGGLVTFADSGWLASIVVPFQPHVIGQPADTTVLWGYGLAVDRPGTFVESR